MLGLGRAVHPEGSAPPVCCTLWFTTEPVSEYRSMQVLSMSKQALSVIVFPMSRRTPHEALVVVVAQIAGERNAAIRAIRAAVQLQAIDVITARASV